MLVTNFTEVLGAEILLTLLKWQKGRNRSAIFALARMHSAGADGVVYMYILQLFAFFHQEILEVLSSELLSTQYLLLRATFYLSRYSIYSVYEWTISGIFGSVGSLHGWQHRFKLSVAVTCSSKWVHLAGIRQYHCCRAYINGDFRIWDAWTVLVRINIYLKKTEN